MSQSDFEQLKRIVDRALEDKKLTRAEQREIMNAILADNEISPEEQKLLESIAVRIRQGEIKAVD